MRKIGLALIWVAVLGGLVYGVYWLYGSWWSSGGANKTLTKAGQVLDQTTKAAASDLFSDLTRKTTDYLKTGTAELIAAAGQGLVNLGNNLENGPATPVQKLAGANNGLLPVASGPAFSVPPPTAAIIAAVNTPLVFAVNLGSSYKVDWGDGQVASGTLPSATTKLLSHAWSAAGDYTVKLDVLESGADNYFAFPVRIYAQ
ncbi:MAG: hypothetical protein UY51_C0005G0072 [Candidatus Jorgensenbacteria bacterium GW2011_GWB1_49_9]|nr:MAG: hypothetical protein UY51_C0005G0072 [Candidatus Jorgensenbacteria bacterium GW2011_GWB1_49_9]